MASISLVMIVKNEEEILDRCLESVKAIVDEFVIVDTGSTDRTKEIIAKYGQVFETPFENYVDTKNKAIALATGDYILFMDADERVCEGLDRLKAYAEQGIDALSCHIVEGLNAPKVITNAYYRHRMWRRDLGWKFDGPHVHEYVCGPGEVIWDSSIRVAHEHTKTTKGDEIAAKLPAYVAWLEAAIEKDPNDARARFYLARTLKDMNYPLKAIEAYKSYLAIEPNYFKDERWQAAYDIAAIYKSLGEYGKAVSWCSEAILIDERRAEAFVLMGRIHYDLQEWEEASYCFLAAVSCEIPKDVILFLDPTQYGTIPADLLAFSLHKLGRHNEALHWAERANASRGYCDARLQGDIYWYRRAVQKTWFLALGATPEPVYGGMIDDVGVGGVETTYLELAKELAAKGQQVFLFCHCEREHKHEGVYFIPYQKMIDYASLKPDVLVVSRWFEAFSMFGSDTKKVIWLQDAYFAPPGDSGMWAAADMIVCSSSWHKGYTAENFGRLIDIRKMRVIPLGIRKEFFEGERHRDPNKIIYSSNPDRGLEMLLKLWPRIREANPDAYLDVYYGWEGLKTWGGGDPAWIDSVRARRDAYLSMAEQAGGVNFKGRLKKADLAKEMMSASLCLYPNNFFETFCITALETQAAGVPMVTSDMGAMPTTLKRECNVLIEGDPLSSEYADRFTQAALSVLESSDRLREMSDKCRRHAMEGEHHWRDIADMWLGAVNAL